METENPDKCWKPDTVLNEDKDMEGEDEDLRNTSENNNEENREYYCRQ